MGRRIFGCPDAGPACTLRPATLHNRDAVSRRGFSDRPTTGGGHAWRWLHRRSRSSFKPSRHIGAGLTTNVQVAIALFFLIAGRIVLSYLGVTVHAFSISGGILLFVAAMPMLFGQRGGLQAPEPKEKGGHDISVFPLAMPLLSGPGTIATILLLTSQAGGDMSRMIAIGIATAIVFLVSFVSLHLGARLIRLLGEGGVHIATRVMGIVLAALAVQYVLNGITGYYKLLAGR